MKYLIIALMPFLLFGCAGSYTPAWVFYDQCAQQSSSFIAIAKCGATQRNAYCMAHNNCTANDNSFVAYIDSLVASVRKGEITEEEARRRWIEFRANQVNAYTQQQILSTPRQTTCISNGYIVNCF